MLFLMFRADNSRYVLDATQVVEVLPLVEVTAIPGAPSAVAGLFSYRGNPVPVIDLAGLMVARPARPYLSTRIIVVRYLPARNREEYHPLGLMAEGTTEVMRRSRADFVPSGVTNGATPHLGRVASDVHGIVQWVHVPQLFPPALQELLFVAGAS